MNALVVLGIVAAFVVATYPLLLLGLAVGLALPPVVRTVGSRWRREPTGTDEPPRPAPAR